MADGGNVIFKFLGDDKQLQKTLSNIGGIAKKALTGVAVGVASVTAAFTGVVTASVKARGEIEQSLGGVETLFKENADMVIENAQKAYKTAGISANEYMQGVTSFSASLLQSLAGDTEKAAKVADMAFIDMADNANKFGTSMESIQTAYQGFAKQNYTMLDNLKLGYGGTKSEMERLLKDAKKLTGVKYDINNLSDVYNAIHAIQEQLGVTGTTAKEASETLSGSIASAKAAWENFLSGQGNMGDVVETARTAFDNIKRIVEEALPDIMDNIRDWLPEILQLVGDILSMVGQALIDNLPMILDTLGYILDSLITAIDNNKEAIGQVMIKLMQVARKSYG